MRLVPVRRAFAPRSLLRWRPAPPPTKAVTLIVKTRTAQAEVVSGAAAGTVRAGTYERRQPGMPPASSPARFDHPGGTGLPRFAKKYPGMYQ